MHSRMGGSLSTLLLSLPLAGVACMAMFGIPQFAPLVASGNDEELSRAGGRRGGRDSSNERFFEEFPAQDSSSAPAFDEHAPMVKSSGTSWWEQPHQAQLESPRSNRSGRAASAVETSSWSENSPAGDFQERGSGGIPVSFGAATQLPARDHFSEQHDWQSASRRLKEIGVEDYHLERGHAEGSYLFVCLFQPAGSPQVVRRFEAEAPDPLQAVNAVLQQIDGWLKTQYAGGGTASPYRTSSL